jgi:hypothetical protein
MFKHSRFVRFAFFAALLIIGLVAICTGHAIGAGAVFASAVLTRNDLEEILGQIFNIVDGAGDKKEDMRCALEEAADLADPDTELERAGDGTWFVVEGDDLDADDLDADDSSDADEDE